VSRIWCDSGSTEYDRRSRTSNPASTRAIGNNRKKVQEEASYILRRAITGKQNTSRADRDAPRTLRSNESTTIPPTNKRNVTAVLVIEDSFIHSFIHQWLYSILLGTGLFFTFVIVFKSSVGLVWRGIGPSQSRYLHIEQHRHRIIAHTDIHYLSGTRTHDPNVRASEDGSCLRSRGRCDRLVTEDYHSKIQMILDKPVYKNLTTDSTSEQKKDGFPCKEVRHRIGFVEDFSCIGSNQAVWTARGPQAGFATEICSKLHWLTEAWIDTISDTSGLRFSREVRTLDQKASISLVRKYTITVFKTRTFCWGSTWSHCLRKYQ
jgi:hypothetical protein